ncbi:unnamed protein product [Notodromas monacha]|uniref:KANL2-like probable zinc-finger domain-containing protein n=1 Tax=Notodromas monacha TaxID=399045 RepID=A0A7R9BDR7_9CRUS|nr:unnamed protein product [Notodromas monacha]CAG0913527.1 unnamed protein product [Notodromas monacha]
MADLSKGSVNGDCRAVASTSTASVGCGTDPYDFVEEPPKSRLTNKLLRKPRRTDGSGSYVLVAPHPVGATIRLPSSVVRPVSYSKSSRPTAPQRERAEDVRPPSYFARLAKSESSFPLNGFVGPKGVFSRNLLHPSSGTACSTAKTKNLSYVNGTVYVNGGYLSPPPLKQQIRVPPPPQFCVSRFRFPAASNQSAINASTQHRVSSCEDSWKNAQISPVPMPSVRKTSEEARVPPKTDTTSATLFSPGVNVLHNPSVSPKSTSNDSIRLPSFEVLRGEVASPSETVNASSLITWHAERKDNLVVASELPTEKTSVVVQGKEKDKKEPPSEKEPPVLKECDVRSYKHRKRRKKKKPLSSNPKRYETRTVNWVNVAPKVPARVKPVIVENVPDDLKQLRDLQIAMRMESKSLFPLGLVPSDSEDSDDDDFSFQKHWFFSDSSSIKQIGCSSPVDIRRRQLSEMKKSLKRRNKQLKESLQVSVMRDGERKFREASLLISCSRKHSGLMEYVLADFDAASKPPTMKALSKRLSVAPRRCCFMLKNEEECTPRECGATSLPLTRYCRLHIWHCKDQYLFQRCETTKEEQRCDNPAVLTKNDLPICEHHLFAVSASSENSSPMSKTKKRSRNGPLFRRRKKRAIANPVLPGSVSETTTAVECPFEAEPLEPPFIADPSLLLPDIPDAENLLDAADINDVLYHMPDEAFSDLFSAEGNGVLNLEPSLEESNALEEALLKACNDVQTLTEGIEKLTEPLPTSGSSQQSATALHRPEDEPLISYPTTVPVAIPPQPAPINVTISGFTSATTSIHRPVTIWSQPYVTIPSVMETQPVFVSQIPTAPPPPLPPLIPKPREIVLETHVIPTPMERRVGNASIRTVVTLAPVSRP